MNQEPFDPNYSKTKDISATTASASVTLDATDVSSTPTQPGAGPSGGHSIMRIVNAGPNNARLRWGVGAQTALITDMLMLAGTVEVFTKAGTVDTVAAICPTGTATISITCGQGF